MCDFLELEEGDEFGRREEVGDVGADVYAHVRLLGVVAILRLQLPCLCQPCE